MNKIKNKIPALRFPEFKGEWEKVSLDGLAKIIDCKHRTPPYVESGIPVVSPGTIKWGEIDLKSPTKRVTEEEYLSLMDHCTLEYGDMVFSRNQSLGVASILLKKEKFVLGQDTVLIKVDKANSFFIYYKIQTNSFQTLISKLSGGSTFSRINLGDIRKLNMNITPNLPEQQKIADFLTAVDGKINQLTRKKTLLEQYKKGVMQKIFSQEIRFKDDEGKDFPEWGVKRLGEVGKNIIGLTYSPSDITHDFDGTVVLRSSNIKDERLSLVDKVKVKSEIINKKLLIHENDILICTRNGSQQLIGKNVLLKGLGSGFTFGAFMSVFRSSLNPFVTHLFKTDSFRRQIYVNLGARINQITTGNLNKFKFRFPSLPEQKKIVGFLTGIDKKIEAVNSQLETTKKWKKGLLQHMFV
jgi:type I restriction enzyme S subunit